jgi:hypothetical protein
MMKLPFVLAALLLSGTANAQSTPTLVQQLTANLAYQQQEAADECPGGGCYHYYAAQRLSTQLAAAIAAAAAGTPLPPLMTEAGGIAPVYNGGTSNGAWSGHNGR